MVVGREGGKKERKGEEEGAVRVLCLNLRVYCRVDREED